MGKIAAARLLALALLVSAAPAVARDGKELAGSWQLVFDRTGASCRILFEDTRSDTGDYFLAMPSACRHAMPGIAAVGRWAAPDDRHLALHAPGGAVLLMLDAAGDGFTSAGPVGTYRLTPVTAARGDGGAVVASHAGGTAPAAAPAGSAPPPSAAAALSLAPKLERVSTRHRDAPAAADLAGRYAVMREAHDTGCMLTLDNAHAKGGDRAQLAPGCRDQGIVVFDPTSWQIVRGALVLTARAGHQTRLERGEGGTWAKDPKDGGKPLGLKKL